MTEEIQERPKIVAPPVMEYLLMEPGQILSDLPEVDYPYYVFNKHGWYICKPGLYGWSVTRVKDAPASFTDKLADLGDSNKAGHWAPSGIRFPQWIVDQAVDWFTRVYDQFKTEAEVCITYNWTEKRFRVYVPEQYVGHGGVDYKVDPTHLESGWAIVGTIHSHCDFGAFHSGTDTHDAEGQEGLHITIGHLKRKIGPEFAQMLMINKTKIDLDYAEAVDAEATDGPHTAPDWWFQHLHTGQVNAPWKAGYRPQQFDHSRQPGAGWSAGAPQYTPGKYFTPPQGWRSVYDTRSVGGYITRYIVPLEIKAGNGTIIPVPHILNGSTPTWIDWFVSLDVDPRPYLFNSENYPEWWEQNPGYTEYFVPKTMISELVQKFGSPFTARDKFLADKRLAEAKEVKPKGKQEPLPGFTDEQFLDDNFFDSWWGKVVAEADRTGKDPDDVAEDDLRARFGDAAIDSIYNPDMDADEEEEPADRETAEREARFALELVERDLKAAGLDLSFDISRSVNPQQMLQQGA